jgi:hypothetical protein
MTFYSIYLFIIFSQWFHWEIISTLNFYILCVVIFLNLHSLCRNNCKHVWLWRTVFIIFINKILNVHIPYRSYIFLTLGGQGRASINEAVCYRTLCMSSGVGRGDGRDRSEQEKGHLQGFFPIGLILELLLWIPQSLCVSTQLKIWKFYYLPPTSSSQWCTNFQSWHPACAVICSVVTAGRAPSGRCVIAPY